MWSDFVSELKVGPKIENKVSLGNIITILTGCIALFGTVVTVQGDIKALAQRVSDGEARSNKTADTLDSVKGAVIELRTEQKGIRSDIDRQGRQLDRIESILQQQQKKGGNE